MTSQETPATSSINTNGNDNNNDNGAVADAEWQSLMGDDLVYKPFQTVASSNPDIGVEDVVQVQLVGRCSPTRSQALDGPIFHKAQCLWMQVGARDVIPAVEMAVRFMHVGETGVVWSHSKYAYGLAGRTYNETGSNDGGTDNSVYTLPTASNVSYEITVLKRIDSMDTYESIIDLAKARKDQANDMYAYEWYNGKGKTRIKQAYERIVKDMQALLTNEAHEETKLSEDLRNAAQTLLIDALNNITAVLLRAHEYRAAKQASVAVLELDPNNYKALIRAAKAALMDPSSDFQEVSMALEAAAAHSHEEGVQKDLEKLKQDFLRRKQTYEKLSKQMFKSAFNGKKSGETAKVAKEEAARTEPIKTQTPSQTARETAPATTVETTNDSFEYYGRLVWKYVLPYGFQMLLLFYFLMWQFVLYNRSEQKESQVQDGQSVLPTDNDL